jgi:hypothetical protein
MKNLRILDLAGNTIKLKGRLFMDEIESTRLREKTLPNIIELNLSKNELTSKECHFVLQDPIFEKVRKIDLSNNNIDFAFTDTNGYCLLAKLATLKFSNNILKNEGYMIFSSNFI